MKRKYSIKLEFIVMYFFSFVIPILISMSIIATYLKNQYTNQTNVSIENQLETVSEEISTYLGDLNRVTTLPYYNQYFISSLSTVLKKDNKTTSEYERFLAEVSLREDLNSIMLIARKEIISTVLVTADNFVSGSSRDNGYSSLHSFDFSKKPWYIGAEKFNGNPYVTGIHAQDYFKDDPGTKVFSVARQIKDPVTGRNLAVIMSDAKTSVFDDIFSKLKYNIPSKFVLLDESDNMIFSTGYIREATLVSMQNNKVLKEGKESYIVKIKNLGNYNWKIAMIVSDSSIKRQLISIYEVCIFFVIAGLIVTYLIFHVLFKDISIPIKKMMKVIKEVEKGNFDVRVSKFKVFEIGELSSALNSMIEKLDESIDKEYKLVIQQKNAEFKALQSQIHPHFLYNTLNGFIGLNRLGERDLLERSILNLTKMLRYALEDRNLVSIKEEFSFLQDYSDLQLLRFEDRMKVNISCDDKIKAYLIPKFLLQPIVENAMIHGIEPSEKPCELNITGDTDEGNIIFNVSDNGCGCDSSTCKEGVGVSNTKNRLLLFNKSSEFYFQSSPNKGTHIKIMIPMEDLINENSDCR